MTWCSKKSLACVAFVAVLVLGSLLARYFPEPANTVDSNHSVTKTLRYNFELENTGSQFIADSQFFAFAPVKETSSQKLVELKASHEYTLKSDDFGNQVMQFSLRNIKPFSRKIITITAKVKLYENPRNFSFLAKDGDRSIFTNSEKYIETKDPKIAETATKLEADFSKKVKTSATIQGLPVITNSWVSNHIKYSGYLSKNFGASYALEKARGDCTEYMFLFVALLRANKVPAVGVAGFPVTNNGQLLSAEQYHNWAQYYEDGVWQIADPQGGLINEAYQQYVAFKIFAPDDASVMENSQRFLAVDQRLKVTME